MPRRPEILHQDLPQSVTVAVPESDMLWACAHPDVDTIIVWVHDRQAGRPQELEFSLAEGRFLARAEREQALPPRREYPLPLELVRVVQSSRLLPESDHRYDTYEVFHWERPEQIATCGQDYFTPVYRDPAIVIREAVDKALFPYTYRSWSRDDRIAHWVAHIYRGRRQAGESGHEENAVYDADLWKRMTDLDPDVDELVPNIAAALARMDMSDPDRMLAAFRRGTGT